MKTILPPSPRCSTTGRFAGILIKTTAALALLGVTVALAGIYYEPDSAPPPASPAMEPKQTITTPKVDRAVGKIIPPLLTRPVANPPAAIAGDPVLFPPVTSTQAFESIQTFKCSN